MLEHHYSNQHDAKNHSNINIFLSLEQFSTHLTLLDISNNQIEWLPVNMLENNKQLKKLYLWQNNIMVLPDELLRYMVLLRMFANA